MTYREAIKLGESILQKADITDAKNDAWLLLAMACKIDRTYYYVHMDEELTTEQTREFQSVLKKPYFLLNCSIRPRAWLAFCCPV